MTTPKITITPGAAVMVWPYGEGKFCVCEQPTGPWRWNTLAAFDTMQDALDAIAAAWKEAGE